ncbi:hypothetical protein MMARV_C012P1 [viral metagenome]|uniref:Uncharacterized protein n=1 Tax=viral metagenome TaxID=1070528 RepID=A0A6L2ZJA5_9ZZZZ
MVKRRESHATKRPIVFPLETPNEFENKNRAELEEMGAYLETELRGCWNPGNRAYMVVPVKTPDWVKETVRVYDMMHENGESMLCIKMNPDWEDEIGPGNCTWRKRMGNNSWLLHMQKDHEVSCLNLHKPEGSVVMLIGTEDNKNDKDDPSKSQMTDHTWDKAGTVKEIKHMRSGLRKLHEVEKRVIDMNTMDGPLTEKKVESAGHPTRQEIYHKTEGTTVDLRFSLIAQRKGMVKVKYVVGRKWTPKYIGNVIDMEVQKVGDISPHLHSAFAGLTANVRDKQVMNAFAAISRTFSQAKADSVPDSIRTQVSQLLATKLNYTRLLVRLAAMHMSTQIIEADGSETTYELGLELGEVENMHTPMDLSRVMRDAMRSARNYIFIESQGDTSIDIERLQTLQMATSQHWPFRKVGLGVENLWPKINNLNVLTDQRERVHRPNERVIKSSEIWEVIEMVVNQHHLQQEWREAVELVSLFALRPEGHSMANGSNYIVTRLPTLDLRAGALGPLLATVRNWENNAFILSEDRIVDYYTKGIAQYAEWTLTSAEVLHMLGLKTIMYTENKLDRDSRETYAQTKQMLVQHMRCYGGKLSIAEKSRRVATAMFGGSVLSTWSALVGYSDRRLVQDKFEMSGTSKVAFQWEEWLPYMNKTATKAAVTGTLSAYAPQGMRSLNMWYRSEKIVGAQDSSSALYYVASVGIHNFGMMEYGADGLISMSKFTPLRNYRGEIADRQFEVVEVIGGKRIESMFQIKTVEQLLAINHIHEHKSQLTWYISELVSADDKLEAYSDAYVDSSIDQVVALLQKAERMRRREFEAKVKETLDDANTKAKESMQKKLQEQEERKIEARGRKGLTQEDVWATKLSALFHSQEIVWAEKVAEASHIDNRIADRSRVMRMFDEARTSYESMPPEMMCIMVEPENRPNLLKIAGLLVEKMASMGTIDGVEIYMREAAKLNNMAAALANNSAMNLDELRIVHGEDAMKKAKEAGIDDETITECLHRGLTWGDMLNATPEILRKYMKQAEQFTVENIIQKVQELEGWLSAEEIGELRNKLNAEKETESTKTMPDEEYQQQLEEKQKLEAERKENIQETTDIQETQTKGEGNDSELERRKTAESEDFLDRDYSDMPPLESGDGSQSATYAETSSQETTTLPQIQGVTFTDVTGQHT